MRAHFKITFRTQKTLAPNPKLVFVKQSLNNVLYKRPSTNMSVLKIRL